jgi:hypothetical protein
MALNDRELLARTLQAEAGNQGLGGMIAAGSVIMNRLGSNGSLRNVILKPGQFSAWNSVTGYAGGEQGQNMDFTPSAEAYKAADALLSGEYQDPTGGATHYYNPSISTPSWGQEAGGQWTKIGAHLFGTPSGENRTTTPRVNAREVSPMDGQQPMQQQMPQEGPQGLMGFLRDPRTRQVLASFSRSSVGQRLGEIAASDLQRQQALEDEQRKLGMATDQRNRTAEWLRTQPNGEKFAAAIEAGMPANQVYQAYMASAQQPETYKPMTGKQINEQFGTSLPEDKLFNISPKGQITQVGGGGVTIEGDKGVDEFAKQDAKTLSDTFTAGTTAKSNLNKINRLSSLLANVETGSMASLKSTMGNFGIETEGLGDIQAAEALINAMVPAQRPAGSGPMSDADLDLFKRSLPRLINQPYGNQIIIQTLRGIAEYDAMGADIVQQYREGKISKPEAFQQLMNRPDPFAAQTDPSSYLPQE